MPPLAESTALFKDIANILRKGYSVITITTIIPSVHKISKSVIFLSCFTVYPPLSSVLVYLAIPFLLIVVFKYYNENDTNYLFENINYYNIVIIKHVNYLIQCI